MRTSRGLLSVAAILLLAIPVIAAAREKRDQTDAVSIRFQLTKFMYPDAKRSTFRLTVEKPRQGLVAEATCDLRKGKQGMGRFPLQDTKPREDSDVTEFRIACLFDDFVKDSIIHVVVRDELSGEVLAGERIQLRDAELATEKSPGVDLDLGKTDFNEASTLGNIHTLAGKWKAAKAFHPLLDSKLVVAGQTGFAISLDQELGDTYRKDQDASKSSEAFGQYITLLEKNGHAAVASGEIHFDYGGNSELVVTLKDGSLYLWYGVVLGGNPRIFLGRGATADSVETLVVEWSACCSNSPVDVDREFATIVYERVGSRTKSLKSGEEK